MKCDEIRELISCMLDNELNAEDSAKVTDHLAGCPECMRVFEAFNAVSLSLDQLEDVPAGFTADVMDKVHHTAQRKAKQNPKPTHLRFVRMAALAACVALVLLAGSQILTAPLYTGGGSPDVANFIRTAQDGQFTPTPAPTPAQQLADMESGPATMSLEDETPANTNAVSVTETATPVTTPTPVPVITPTPLPAVTPTPVPSPMLTMETDLLVVTEPAQSGKFPAPPAMELAVTAKDGTTNELSLWSDGDRLYCENRTAGTAYYTIGTPDELSRLTGLPVG